MTYLRLPAVRFVLAIFLMAVSTLAAGQWSRVIVNNIQHELGVDHSDPMQVAITAQTHGDHDHADSLPLSDQGGEPMPATHHHHSEVLHIAALSSVSSAPVLLNASRADFAVLDSRLTSSGPPRLERPPRS